MDNDAFYQVIFQDFWRNIDRDRLVVDDHSMFADEAVFQWLVDVVRPRDIIEIGSWKGHSANFMIDCCKKIGLKSNIVCVDTFLGGPEHWLLPGMLEELHRSNGRPTILERFLGNTIKRQNETRVFPLTADSLSASEIFKFHGFRADLIFVDGAHDPVSVEADIMRYYPLLSEEGVMFGDDYQYEPLATTVHACALRLGVQVLVSARKWVFANQALMKRLTLPDIQVRHQFEGSIHP